MPDAVVLKEIDMGNDLLAGFVLLILINVFSAVLLFSIVENDCQRKHDVFDCEWARTPFLPVTPED